MLYNMEGSPYCRKAREALSELDLEYVVRNVPKGSPKRRDLIVRGGKMQVPYLIGYKGKGGTAAQDGVTRQWIIKTGDTSWKEYMSQWYWTNPQPNLIGLSLPTAAPAWTKINAQVAGFTWQTDPATLRANTADFTDADQWLVAADAATVTTTADSASVELNGTSPIPINPTALANAMSRCDMPPCSMSWPANTNSGIASSVEESVPAAVSMTSTSAGKPR